MSNCFIYFEKRPNGISLLMVKQWYIVAINFVTGIFPAAVILIVDRFTDNVTLKVINHYVVLSADCLKETGLSSLLLPDSTIRAAHKKPNNNTKH